MIVPITTLSRLTARALSEALSLGREVVAVTVVFDDDPTSASVARRWKEWDPGVPLQVLHTEYASVVEPIVAFIDEQRGARDEQIVVLIPVVIPDRLRYRLLHNHLEVALSAALRTRSDVIVARVPMSVDSDDEPPAADDGAADDPATPGRRTPS